MVLNGTRVRIDQYGNTSPHIFAKVQRNVGHVDKRVQRQHKRLSLRRHGPADSKDAGQQRDLLLQPLLRSRGQRQGPWRIAFRFCGFCVF